MSWPARLAPSLLIAACLLVHPAAARAFITIYADSTRGEVPRRVIGFLHGKDEQGSLNDSLVTTLRPKNWRLAKFVTYDFVNDLDIDVDITYETAFSYAYSQGGWSQAKPWLDWEEYESFVATYLNYVAYYFPDNQPAFYDVWNEPDLSSFWTGTYQQLLELFARAHAVIKAHDPEAKIVGPSVARYDPASSGVRNVVGFLADLDSVYGVMLDAISWHENESGTFGSDLPEEILDHEAQIRADLAEHFPPDYQPELHINEHTGGNVHLSPGYNVGYLYYLTESTVDAAMRACWYVYSEAPGPDPVWCDCWSGLDGMFTQDALTPTHAYWVYKAYVDMLGSQLLKTHSFFSTTNAIAARDDATETMRVLVGRYHHYSTADVTLRVRGYPYDHSAVSVYGGRIPHYPEMFEQPRPRLDPLPDGPIDTWETSLAVTGGGFDIPLEGFADNDAYVLVITEDLPTRVEEMAEDSPAGPVLRSLSPNPFRERLDIRFALPRPARVELALFDPRGRRKGLLLDETRESGEHSVSWSAGQASGRDLPPGVYFLRLATETEWVASRVVLLR